MNIENLEELFEVFGSQSENIDVLKVLREFGLLRSQLRCKKNTCRCNCLSVKREKHVLGHAFFCRRCKTLYSVLTDSLFEQVRVSIRKVIQLLFFWSCLTPVAVVSRLINMRKGSICRQYRFFRNIVSWKLSQVPELFRLGGVGHVVQIDESVITKRKYNVGRVVPQVWVLGMVDTTTKREVVVYIRNRSVEVIISKICKHVIPGSEIWTDKWRAYDQLSILSGVSPYTHKSVNHSIYFVDPNTGVNTNFIEGYWSRLKSFLRKKHVMQSRFVAQHIDHFMWFQIYGSDTPSTFKNIIEHITEKYAFKNS